MFRTVTRCDDSFDDNCDDSCCPSDAAYTTICDRSCLVTAPARSWRCWDQVPRAASRSMLWSVAGQLGDCSPFGTTKSALPHPGGKILAIAWEQIWEPNSVKPPQIGATGREGSDTRPCLTSACATTRASQNPWDTAHNLAIARRHSINRLPRRHEERRTARAATAASTSTASSRNGA